MFKIGDLVRIDWKEGNKRLGIGIVIEHYPTGPNPVLVWWTKVGESGWEDTEMLIAG